MCNAELDGKKRFFIVLTINGAQYLSGLRCTKRQNRNVMAMSIGCGAKWSDEKEMWVGKICFVCSCKCGTKGRKEERTKSGRMVAFVCQCGDTEELFSLSFFK